ncbi:hypothetical protein [Calothrix sp. NIES-2098]|uniref:hypothetical protein n=1 Tax=Calothrix sp. NIES-2098 TaxID=1954171 RepID=UPI000B61E2EE|nr:hypothetical protein NIES2098_40340 [Calothrix sp. NIES-2098]
MTTTPEPTATRTELAYQSGYSQALKDYAIANFLEALQQTNSILLPSESSLIAALLIEKLPQAIDPELVSHYLHVVREGYAIDAFTTPITLEYPQSVELPQLSDIPAPCYSVGTKVRLTPIDGAAEWGTLIGYYLCYAPHRCRWMYRYILYLESNSPSAAWMKSTFAWEEEIESRLEETS